ncbi:MAG: lysophospholipid acyltransferase family protein [Deferrisomatales bacterium]
MQSLRAAWFAVAAVGTTLVLGLAAVGAGYLDPARSWAPRLMPLWSRALLRLGAVRVEVEGAEHLPRGRAAVFVANHQSNLDIPVLGSVLPSETRWLAKRELFRVPVLGAAMRALGYIPVDRKNPGASRSSIGAAARQVAAGAPVLLFPEGTRSPDGRLLPFKPGFVHLAAEARAPVVPVVIEGSGVLWPKGALVGRPGRVRVRFMPAVEVGDVEEGAARRHAEALRSAMACALEGT